MARFQDIPRFTRHACYMVNVSLNYLPRAYTRYVMDYGLDVSPDFQRGHVWTPQQKVRFMEYMLRGGTSGLDIYTNAPTWNRGRLGPKYPESWFVLVDGKQRLDAALGFLNNEFPVFGAYFREYTDTPRIVQSNFRWHVNDLATREECLQWYLDLNTGGTVHSEEELEKVRSLLREKNTYARPSPDEISANANLGREVIQEAIREAEEENKRLEASRRTAEEAAAKKTTRKRGRK